MDKRPENSVLNIDEIKAIKLEFIKELKDNLTFVNDSIADNAIWAFLDSSEQKILNADPKLKKSRADISWKLIKKEFDIDKTTVSKRLNKFIKDDFKRGIILRDIGNAYSLLSLGFYKECVIISGGVIEEILRLYLMSKHLQSGNSFNDYIKSCEKNNLLKTGVTKLSDFLREFRNLVHIGREKSKDDTLKISIAKSAVASIFTIMEEINNACLQ